MVEPNTTLFPLWGTLGTVVNTVKVLIGGAFGLYLIILYFRVREYIVVRRLLLNIQADIRVLAEKQGVEMGPVRRLPTVYSYMKDYLRRRAEKISMKKGSATTHPKRK